MQEYNQPSAAPVPKVGAVAQAGVGIAAVVTILTLFGVTIPEGLTAQAEAAIKAGFIIVTFVQAFLQFAAGYLKKDVKPDAVVKAIEKSSK